MANFIGGLAHHAWSSEAPSLYAFSQHQLFDHIGIDYKDHLSAFRLTDPISAHLNEALTEICV